MFSVGVILFVIVQGIFPFGEAKPDDYYYRHIACGKNENYWKHVGDKALSDEFKDLFQQIISYNPNKRPSIEEVRNHPWMKKSGDHDEGERIKLRKNI